MTEPELRLWCVPWQAACKPCGCSAGGGGCAARADVRTACSSARTRMVSRHCGGPCALSGPASGHSSCRSEGRKRDARRGDSSENNVSIISMAMLPVHWQGNCIFAWWLREKKKTLLHYTVGLPSGYFSISVEGKTQRITTKQQQLSQPGTNTTNGTNISSVTEVQRKRSQIITHGAKKGEKEGRKKGTNEKMKKERMEGKEKNRGEKEEKRRNEGRKWGKEGQGRRDRRKKRRNEARRKERMEVRKEEGRKEAVQKEKETKWKTNLMSSEALCRCVAPPTLGTAERFLSGVAELVFLQVSDLKETLSAAETPVAPLSGLRLCCRGRSILLGCFHGNSLVCNGLCVLRGAPLPLPLPLYVFGQGGVCGGCLQPVGKAVNAAGFGCQAGAAADRWRYRVTCRCCGVTTWDVGTVFPLPPVLLLRLSYISFSCWCVYCSGLQRLDVFLHIFCPTKGSSGTWLVPWWQKQLVPVSQMAPLIVLFLCKVNIYWLLVVKVETLKTPIFSFQSYEGDCWLVIWLINKYLYHSSEINMNWLIFHSINYHKVGMKFTHRCPILCTNSL